MGILERERSQSRQTRRAQQMLAQYVQQLSLIPDVYAAYHETYTKIEILVLDHGGRPASIEGQNNF